MTSKTTTKTSTSGYMASLSDWAKSIPQPVRTWSVRVGWLVGLYLAVVVVTAMAIYVLGWRGGVADAVARVTYYPVIQVGGRSADYHQYYVSSGVLAKSGVHNSKQLTQLTLSQLESDLIVAGWAADHGITVTSSEAKQAMDQQLTAMGGTKIGLAKVKQTYGYTESDYQSYIRRQLLQQKVTAALSSDTDYETALRSKAEAILKQALAGNNFDKLAGAYSQDVTAIMTGDKALVAVSALPQPVASAAAKLTDGQVYAHVISHAGNQYILRRVRANGTEVMVRIIELKPSFAQWMTRQVAQANVIKFMPAH